MQVTTEDLALARGLARAIQAEADESAANYGLRIWEATERAKTMARDLAAGDAEPTPAQIATDLRREIADLNEQQRRIEACARLAQATATAYAGVDEDAARAALDRVAAYAEDAEAAQYRLDAKIAALDAEGHAAKDAEAIEASGSGDRSFIRFGGGEAVRFE